VIVPISCKCRYNGTSSHPTALPLEASSPSAAMPVDDCHAALV
jgi:hypothetical protein